MAELNATQVRDALAWATNKQPTDEPEETPWEWFWTAIQGDFNDDRSTKQILMDAAISMIPGIDQICDLRDFIANCKKIHKDASDHWAWVSLVLTLIGLIPTVGSLLKGVLKIVFAFVTRMGKAAMVDAIDKSLTWVITFLRRREIQKYIKLKNIDEVLLWLASETKLLKARIKLPTLLKAFDDGIRVTSALIEKVRHIPIIGTNALSVLNKINAVRLKADDEIRQALEPVMEILDSTVIALERRAFREKHGILDVQNVHFRGTLPESTALTLMRKPDHPAWLSDGAPTKWHKADAAVERSKVEQRVASGWPPLTNTNIGSFHKLTADTIKGPARIYRIVSPSSRAMGDCWISESVFKRLQADPDPRAAWRRFLAVWPDWNANGQFVEYTIKDGESLKVWRGEASAQTNDKLADRYLEGGFEQIVFKLSRTDIANDTMKYYKLTGVKGNVLAAPIDQQAYDLLSKADQNDYTSIREAINHPNISGPHDTGWGTTDFGGSGFVDRIGLPSFPGQITTER